MDGFEVCRAIKQAPATRQIPVLLLLASDDDVQRERALQAGADDVVIKPVERTLLLTLVRGQLRLARLDDQVHDLEGLVMTLARAVEDREQSSAGLAEKVAHWATQLGSAPVVLVGAYLVLVAAVINEIDGTLEIGPVKIPMPRRVVESGERQCSDSASEPENVDDPPARFAPPDLSDVPSITAKKSTPSPG